MRFAFGENASIVNGDIVEVPNGYRMTMQRKTSRHLCVYDAASDTWTVAPALPVRYPQTFLLCLEAHRWAWDGAVFRRVQQ